MAGRPLLCESGQPLHLFALVSRSTEFRANLLTPPPPMYVALMSWACVLGLGMSGGSKRVAAVNDGLEEEQATWSHESDRWH